jgi:predicted O-linked N-acetylglucosamine transferase (SPINDLY family)
MSTLLIRQLRQAEKRLHAGEAAAALALCEQVLRKAPRNPDALLLLGTAQLALNRAAEAAATLGRAVEVDPKYGAALESLGLAHLILGRYAEAEDALARAARLSGAPASVFMRLGVAMLEQQRAADAAIPLQRAVALAPQDADAQMNLGRALAETGDWAAARERFHAAMQLAPASAEAEFNLGVLALRAEDWAEARRWFEQALAKSPRFVDALVNLGVVLQKQSQPDAAARCLQQAVALDPSHAHARSELAHARLAQGMQEQAAEHYLSALRIAPGFTAAREGLAAAYLAMGRLDPAIEQLRAVVQSEPDNANAHAALAGTLFERGQLEESEAAALRAMELDAELAGAYTTAANVQLVQGRLDESIATLERGHARTRNTELLGMLTYLLRHACDWPRWAEAWRETKAAIERGDSVDRPFWLLCEPLTAQEQRAYVTRWAAARFGAIERGASVAPTPPARSRLRIGYLSSDLHEHATAYLIAEVLEQHDRSRFETFAYSHGPDDASAMRRRLQAACEHFVDIAREPDDVAAERMRRDALDILVDLKGYTAGDRLTILARRPCRMQLTWLGYPGTTGASFIDGLIADAFVIPRGAEAFYSERVLRLPHCYQPNDRKRAVAEPLARADYGLAGAGLVFCCFNQTYKITPDVFAVWMNLLRSVPDSRLWLLESNARARHNLSTAAHASGIAPARLVFAPKLPNAQHLARYRVADLALDTFPYTSHTTLSDALWCGCPALALCGETFASRVSGSILTSAGMPDLVTHDLDAYRALALRLAAEPQLLQGVRGRLRQARERSPLFDSTGFTRALEALYLDLAKEAANGC